MVLLDFGINIAVALLLAATIAYCWRLEKRIRVLQDSRGELARLLKHFDESTRRASESIATLQTGSRKLGETIQARIDKANFVADDLMFLVERAGKLSDALEAGLAARRAADAALAAGAHKAPPQPAHNVNAPPAPAPKMEVPKPAARPSMDARAMLEALASRKVSDPAARTPRSATLQGAPGLQNAPVPRSQVEHELLELIRTGSGV